MTEFHESKILALVGVVDGANRTFTTPTQYTAGTLRVVWNGQVYEPDDDLKGWLEIDNQTIETTIAPKTGDVLQAFYNDFEPASTVPIDQVKGSPFHPTGLLP